MLLPHDTMVIMMVNKILTIHEYNARESPTTVIL